MKHYELLVEHRYKDSFICARKLKAHAGQFTIGSDRNNHLRLLGEDVGGVHAVIAFQKDHWVIADMGSGNGTWLQKNAIFEEEIKSESTIRIGGHEIRLLPREADIELFAKNADESKKGKSYHQIVIRRNGRVMQTHLLPAKKAFHFVSGGNPVKLDPPESYEWKVQTVGNMEFRQRLVKNAHSIRQIDFSPATLMSPDFRVPVITMASILAVFILAFLFAPHSPNGKMETITLDNPYSKMIYDAKLTRQMQKQSQQLSRKMATHNQKMSGNIGGGTPNPRSGDLSVASTKVIQNIKAAGLSQLIGRISKRASQNAIQFTTVGQDPSSHAAGTVGSVAGVAKAVGANTKNGGNGAFKLGGIGTLGKGGGVAVNPGVSGIGQGGVGKGNVGFIEEEGEVDGGLDRDVIARYIKSQLGQIRYCYERQLSANPDLYGKVQVRFVIGSSGAVVQQAIGTTTLKSAMVEGCILRRVASWKFPEPKGGTSVIVTYPFLFKSTN